MGEVKPWHEDDAFWETVGPVLFTARRWEDTPREVEAMMDLLLASLLAAGCWICAAGWADTPWSSPGEASR